MAVQKFGNRWYAKTKRLGQVIYIGSYLTKDDAERAVVEYRRQRGWPVTRYEIAKDAQKTYQLNRSLGLTR